MPVAMPDGTRRGRLWLWLAHRMAWVWLAMFAAVISQGVIASTAWGVAVDLVIWAAYLALIAAHRHHGLTMCARGARPTCPSMASVRPSESRGACGRCITCSPITAA